MPTILSGFAATATPTLVGRSPSRFDPRPPTLPDATPEPSSSRHDAPLSLLPPILTEADDALNELDGDRGGVLCLKTLLLSLALWWGLWRSGRRLTRRY